jgi:hypothetical protein
VNSPSHSSLSQYISFRPHQKLVTTTNILTRKKQALASVEFHDVHNIQIYLLKSGSQAQNIISHRTSDYHCATIEPTIQFSSVFYQALTSWSIFFEVMRPLWSLYRFKSIITTKQQSSLTAFPHPPNPAVLSLQQLLYRILITVVSVCWSCKLAIFKDVATQGKILTSGNTVLKATLQPPSLLSANPMELKWFLS